MTTFTGNRTMRRAGILVVAGAALALGASQVAPTPVSAQAAPGAAKPILNLLCKFSDDTTPVSSLTTPETVASRFTATAPGLDNYFREMSNGSINLTGTRTIGWVTMPRTKAESNSTLTMQDCLAAAHNQATFTFSDFEVTNLWINGYDQAPAGGRTNAVVEGVYYPRTTWLPMNVDQGVLEHETSHAFGLMYHATADPFTVLSNPYYWPSGYEAAAPFGHMMPGLTAAERDALGWIPSDRKAAVTTDGTRQVTLQSLSQPGASGTLIATTRVGADASTFYTAELRQQTGYDQGLPGAGVIIHKVQTGSSITSAVVMDGNITGGAGDADSTFAAGGPIDPAVWTANEVFTDAVNNISIRVNAITGNTASITITRGTGTMGTPTATPTSTPTATPSPTPAGPPTPASPTNFRATVRRTTEIDLAWNAGSNENPFYRIGRQTGNGWREISYDRGTTFTDRGLQPGVSYTYQIQACNEYKCGPIASTITVSTASTATPTPSATPAPTSTPASTSTPGSGTGSVSTPSGLTATGQTGGSVSLTWNAVAGATSYKVQYQKYSGGAVSTVTVNAAGTTVTGLAVGTWYSFTVAACQGATCSAFSDATLATTAAS